MDGWKNTLLLLLLLLFATSTATTTAPASTAAATATATVAAACYEDDEIEYNGGYRTTVAAVTVSAVRG